MSIAIAEVAGLTGGAFVGNPLSCTLTHPPNVGDVLYAFATLSPTAARPVLQAGWTLLGQSSGVFSPSWALARKVCAAGETPTQTPFSHPAGSQGVTQTGFLWRITGQADPSNIALTTITAPGSLSPSFTTTTGAVGFALAAVVDWQSHTWALPSGFTPDGINHNVEFNAFSHNPSIPTGTNVFTFATGAGVGFLAVLDGLPETVMTLHQNAAARLVTGVTITQLGAARIIGKSQLTQTAKARLAIPIIKTMNAKAVIAGGLPYYMQAQAVLTLPPPMTLTMRAKAVIAGGVPYNMQAVASLAIGSAVNMSAAATLQGITTIGQNAVARLVAGSTLLMTAAARLYSPFVGSPEWVDRDYVAEQVQRITYAAQQRRAPYAK